MSVSLKSEGIIENVNTTINGFKFIGEVHYHTADLAKESYTLSLDIFLENEKVGKVYFKLNSNKTNNMSLIVENEYFETVNTSLLLLMRRLK